MKKLLEIFKMLKEQSPILYWVLVIHGFFTVICLAGIAIDDRILMGVNVWIKPLKFCISDIIYIATVGYLIQFYPYSKRKKNIINNTVAITLLIDLLIIVGQGARGVQSHYNMQNPIDGILFGLMGVIVSINVIIMILFIFDTMRLKLMTTKSMQWSILIGWMVVFLGSWIGGQMISQMSHNIGVADGGEGLPLVNWSTIAGDLRVAHFFGLHGLQVIPLFAYIVSTKWKSTETNKIIAVTIFALLYISFIAHTFYQAKQGIAFLSM